MINGGFLINLGLPKFPEKKKSRSTGVSCGRLTVQSTNQPPANPHRAGHHFDIA